MGVCTYIRVSTQTQVREESYEYQDVEIKHFLQSLGVPITGVYDDLGVSGAIGPAGRPGLEAMIRNIDNYDGVCVYDVSRLSRDMDVGTEFILLLSRRGKKLYNAKDRTVSDFSTAFGKLLEYFKLAVAEEDRNRIKSAQRAGIARARAQGKRLGRKPVVINWQKFDVWMSWGMTKSQAARIPDISNKGSISRFTLYSHLKKRAANENSADTPNGLCNGVGTPDGNISLER